MTGMKARSKGSEQMVRVLRAARRAVLDRMVQGGRQAERAAIVAWLRETDAGAGIRTVIAKAIERLDHIPPAGGEW